MEERRRMAENNYDIAVLGGGPAGYAAAIRASQLGKKVCLVERFFPGGTCLNRGCIPTKAMLASVNLYAKMKKADRFGISVSNVSIDLAKVIERKNRVVKTLTKGVEYLLKQNKVALIKGEGILKGPGVIELRTQNTELRAQKIILATGSEPLDIPGFTIDHSKVLNSNDMLNLTHVPQTMEIIGCGIIGMEFAFMFAELGTKINICEAMPKALPMVDEEVTALLMQISKKKGIEIALNTKVGGPSGKDITLVAVGRKTNTESFKDSGIKMKGRFPEVNNKMETSLPGVYAAGDITGISMQSHVAYAQGKAAAENACGITSQIDLSVIPMCIFTEPEVAAVGLTEAQAKEKGIEIKIGKFPFIALGKAKAMDETEGFVKIMSDSKTDKILGVHIIGPQASNLIAESALAMKLGASAKDIAHTIHAHPTLPEAIMEAAESIFGHAIHI
jgi:dihydrolipoamide dehydrogenase